MQGIPNDFLSTAFLAPRSGSQLWAWLRTDFWFEHATLYTTFLARVVRTFVLELCFYRPDPFAEQGIQIHLLLDVYTSRRSAISFSARYPCLLITRETEMFYSTVMHMLAHKTRDRTSNLLIHCLTKATTTDHANNNSTATVDAISITVPFTTVIDITQSPISACQYKGRTTPTQLSVFCRICVTISQPTLRISDNQHHTT